MTTTSTAPTNQRNRDATYAFASAALAAVSLFALAAGNAGPLTGNAHGLLWFVFAYRLKAHRPHARLIAFVMCAVTCAVSGVVLVVSLLASWPAEAVYWSTIHTLWSALGIWLYQSASPLRSSQR